MESKLEALAKNTMATKLGMWAANVRNNLPIIDSSNDISKLPKITEPALCLGAGPSLALHYDELPKFRGTTLACERNLADCLGHGLVPDYIVSIDGSPIMADFLDNPLVKEHENDIVGIFSVTASPEILEKWNGEKVFFNPWLDNFDDWKSVSTVFQEFTRKTTMHTGGNCGTTLWFLANYLKAQTIALIGLDLAYSADIPDLSHTQIWDSIKHLPKDDILKYYRRETNIFNNEVITDYTWDGFNEAWVSWIKEMPSTTFQCSDFTVVHSEPLKCIEFSEYLLGQ